MVHHRSYGLSLLLTAMALACLFTPVTTRSQNCPKLKVALIQGCVRDGVNEFVVLQTRGQTVGLAGLKVEYSTAVTFPTGASTTTINPTSSINAWKNPTIAPVNGLTNSKGTITPIDPTTTTTIAPNSVVIIIPNGGTVQNPYDLQLPGDVKVLFYDTTHPVGTSSTWVGTGNFVNFGNTGTFLNPRFFRLTTTAGGGCPAAQVTSYTPSNLVRQNGTVGGQVGARVEWDDAADATVTLCDANGTVHYANSGCVSLVLPIRLTDFKATLSGGHIDLQWETAPGSSAVSFVIERSQPGSDFHPIGQVPAQDGSLARQYTFRDNAPLPGNNLYRLSLLDADHEVTYSNILALSLAGSGEITIYPNPVKDRLTISSAAALHTSLELVDPGGRVLQQKTFGGAGTLTLDLSAYPRGLYILRIPEGGATRTFKIFKE